MDEWIGGSMDYQDGLQYVLEQEREQPFALVLAMAAE